LLFGLSCHHYLPFNLLAIWPPPMYIGLLLEKAQLLLIATSCIGITVEGVWGLGIFSAFCISAFFLYIGLLSVYRPAFCISARRPVFLLQPHASASRLRGCVRVGSLASGDDPVDHGNTRSRDVIEEIGDAVCAAYSCTYTRVGARHLSRQAIIQASRNLLH